jgi:hypothetical protein
MDSDLKHNMPPNTRKSKIELANGAGNISVRDEIGDFRIKSYAPWLMTSVVDEGWR